MQNVNSIKAHDTENETYDYCCLNPPFGSSTVITERDLLTNMNWVKNKKKKSVFCLLKEQ